MTKFRIRYSEISYGQKVEFQNATIEAATFKVNDQGTAIFIDKQGIPVASFKHWVTIKPVEAKEKPIRTNEVKVAVPQRGVEFFGSKGKPVAGPYDHPFTPPYDR